MPMANQACRIGFFADPRSRAVPYDRVELSDRGACVGRLCRLQISDCRFEEVDQLLTDDRRLFLHRPMAGAIDQLHADEF